MVSKCKGSPYRSGRSPDWLKMKNPEASAVSARRKRTGGGNGSPDSLALPPWLQTHHWATGKMPGLDGLTSSIAKLADS
jgi:hypothetical protein